MAPPVPVYKKHEAQELFENLDGKDCILKELVQYECLVNEKLEIVCLPFTRLFKECAVLFKNQSRQIITRKQLFEITEKDTNDFLNDYRADTREFLRANDKLEEFS